MWVWHLFCDSESRLYAGFGNSVGADQVLDCYGWNWQEIGENCMMYSFINWRKLHDV